MPFINRIHNWVDQEKGDRETMEMDLIGENVLTVKEKTAIQKMALQTQNVDVKSLAEQFGSIKSLSSTKSSSSKVMKATAFTQSSNTSSNYSSANKMSHSSLQHANSNLIDLDAIMQTHNDARALLEHHGSSHALHESHSAASITSSQKSYSHQSSAVHESHSQKQLHKMEAIEQHHGHDYEDRMILAEHRPSIDSYVTTASTHRERVMSPNSLQAFAAISVTKNSMMAAEAKVTRVRESSEYHATGFRSDAHAAEQMRILNNKLSDYQMQVFVLEGTNRHLIEELRRMQVPLQNFAKLNISMQSLGSMQQASTYDATLHTEYSKYRSEAEGWRVKYINAEKVCFDQASEIDAMIKRVGILKGEMDQLTEQKKEFDDRYRYAGEDYERLKKEMARIQAEYEAERRERAKFSAQVKQLSNESQSYYAETKSLKQQFAAYSANATINVESDLREKVEEIRKEYEEKRHLLQVDFDAKINEFYSMWTTENKITEKLSLEVADLRAQSERLVTIEREKKELRERMDKLKMQLDAQNEEYNQLQKKFSIDNERWAQMKKMLLDKESAYGGKSKLYGEVVIYRDILDSRAQVKEGYEVVQHHHHHQQHHQTHAEKMHTFQNRTSGHHEGFISLHNCDSEGRFIELKNVSPTIIKLDGYAIEQKSSGRQLENEFLLPNGIILAPKQKLKIWSRDQNKMDKLPYEIVFRKGNWGHEHGGWSTILYDQNGRVNINV